MLWGPGPNRYVPQEPVLSGCLARFPGVACLLVLSNPWPSVRRQLEEIRRGGEGVAGGAPRRIHHGRANRVTHQPELMGGRIWLNGMRLTMLSIA